ncbi:MAG: GNAT family N-acetyltransferase [Vicinamibacteria bacterium]|nr:GNAT family N-acetyltransferase [Vicinamibacteria bacterium]
MSELRATPPVSEQDWKEWDQFVNRHQDASIYHLSDWARVLKRGFGYPARGLALREAGGRIAAVVPLFEVKGLASRRLVGVPFRDRGGVLATSPESERAAYAAASKAMADAGASGVALKSCAPVDEEIARAEGFSVSKYWVHSVMPLQQGDLWDRVGKKNRNMVRQAERNGLTFEWRRGPEHAEAWHQLHRATQSRLGVPVFPRALFEAILDEGREWARFLVILGPKGPVAGGLFFAFARRYVYGYSASTLEGQEMRANDLMLFEALREAERSGAQWFDFGSDSPKQESLLAFKKKWGAAQSLTTVLSIPASNEEHNDSSSGLYSLARGVGRRLPSPLWAALTSPLVRKLG